MNKDDKVFVAGHQGLIGSAILRYLAEHDYTDVITGDSYGLDPTDQGMVLDFFMEERPAHVFLATSKVGGIMANARYPADFIYTNLQVQCNIIHAAWRSGVEKLLFLASSCVYPKRCPQPMKEEYLLTGKLEPTSEPYAIAKIAGVEMCQAYNLQYGTRFIPVVPADVYGPNDDFDLDTSHFLPGLMTRIHQATAHDEDRVVIWGTGTPRRECLFVDDLADACVFLMDNYDYSEVVNIGSGHDFSIGELAGLIGDIVGFAGDIAFDCSKPDGTPRKLLDTTRISSLGWAPRFDPEEGIRQTYAWYREQVAGNGHREGNR